MLRTIVWQSFLQGLLAQIKCMHQRNHVCAKCTSHLLNPILLCVHGSPCIFFQVLCFAFFAEGDCCYALPVDTCQRVCDQRQLQAKLLIFLLQFPSLIVVIIHGGIGILGVKSQDALGPFSSLSCKSCQVGGVWC